MAVDPAKAVIAPYRGFTVQCSLWSEIHYLSVFIRLLLWFLESPVPYYGGMEQGFHSGFGVCMFA
jgi:hypothetical protein